MRDLHQCGKVSLWHRRVLGFVWALAGLFCIWDVHRTYWWAQGQAWLPLLVGIPYLVIGVSFTRGWTWAYAAMGVFAAIAGLIFAYCIFMAGWLGNRPLLYWMLGAFAFAAYTSGFALVTLITRPQKPN